MPAIAPRPALVLDLDGTVHPGTAGAAVLRELLGCGVVRRDAATEALEAIASRTEAAIPFRTTAQVVYTNYATVVKGLPHRALRNAAQLAWGSCRRDVFDFVRPVVSAAIGQGYETVLISGSPAEAVECAAADLGITHHFGTQVRVRDGLCDGCLSRTPGIPGEKVRCLVELGERVPLDLSRSVALGNGNSDDELLSVVGHPIAFEPEHELVAPARDRRWTVADRRTALHVCLRALAASGPPE